MPQDARKGTNMIPDTRERSQEILARHSKAITLHQPYATFVADGLKAIETRGWATSYRGPLLIHAGKRTKDREQEVLDAYDDPYADEALVDLDALPWSAIIAVAELSDCTRMTAAFCEQMRLEDWNEWAMGFYAPGRYAWHLANVRTLPEPIPCRGQQGLWTPDEDVQRRIEEALA